MAATALCGGGICARVSRGSCKKDYDVLDYDNLTKKRVKGNKEFYYVKADAKGEDGLKQSRLWKHAGVLGQAGADGDMPPDEATAKPTDKERETVLRKWLE